MKKAIEYIIRAKDATGAGIKSAMGRIKSLAAGIGRNLTNIQSGLSMAMGAVQKFASVFVKAIGEAFKFEKATSDFKVLLGSIDAAKEHMADLRSFAASTPLTFEDLAKSSKLLLSFGASVDEVMPAMKMLGDIAMGDAQKFQGLSLVFAQVKSAGKLMGQDLLQMINQVFNPLTIISQQTGKSMSELKDMMSEGQISFEMVAEAMRIATSEGGLFNNAMGEAAKTGEGMVSTLQDNWTEAVRTFGEAFSDAAKDGIGSLSGKIQQLTEDGTIAVWADKVKSAIESVISYFRNFADVCGGAVDFVWKKLGLSDAYRGVTSVFQGASAAVGTLAGGGSLSDAGKAYEKASVEEMAKGHYTRKMMKKGWIGGDAVENFLASERDAKIGEEKHEKAVREKSKEKRSQKKSSPTEPSEKKKEKKSLKDLMNDADAKKIAKAEAEAKKKAAKDAAKAAADAEKEEREKLEKKIAAQRKKLIAEEMAARTEAQMAQDRLSAAQEKSRQAWGWYRDQDSLVAQLEEERAEAAAQKQFEKDFEKLKNRRDWRTAAAYGSGSMRSLSLDEEAVRRVALAREEEAVAKEYARQTAEECARSAAALEAIQNTICTEG